MWAEWVALTKMLIFIQPNVCVYHSHLKVPQIVHINTMWLFYGDCDAEWLDEHLE